MRVKWVGLRGVRWPRSSAGRWGRRSESCCAWLGGESVDALSRALAGIDAGLKEREHDPVEAPNRMWGADGIRIQTVEDGWVWGFSAVDHFDAWLRLASSASMPRRSAIASRPCSPLPRDLRPSLAPPAPMPARDERCAWSQAVTEFRDRYNRHWRLEKLGFLSPIEARQSYAIRKAA